MKLPPTQQLVFGILLVIVGLIQMSAATVAFPMWLILLCIGINYIVER